MPLIRIHDVATNQIIDREMTADELAAANARKAAAEEAAEAEAAKATEKATLLERLGITEDEAKLLLS